MESHNHTNFIRLLERLNLASERRQMSLVTDHPWNEPLAHSTWLRAEDKLSIYGTPYWELATQREKEELSKLELASWWQGFIHFERLVSEYYMGLVNRDIFSDFPEVEEYLQHFAKEEIVHSLVFKKAMKHFEISDFNPPENFKNVYTTHFDGSDIPLTDIFLTFVIEWIADLQQRIDVQGPNVSPLASTIVREHGREESRHIVFGRDLVKTFGENDARFLENARQFAPVFCRQFIDSGVCNVEAFERVEFEHPAFMDTESLLAAVVQNENRDAINSKIMRAVLPVFFDANIYHPSHHEIWVDCGFGADVNAVIEKRS